MYVFRQKKRAVLIFNIQKIHVLVANISFLFTEISRSKNKEILTIKNKDFFNRQKQSIFDLLKTRNFCTVKHNVNFNSKKQKTFNLKNQSKFFKLFKYYHLILQIFFK